MSKVKLWNKNFILIIVINFMVFLNHLMILSTFPLFIEYLGYGESVSGVCVAVFCLVSVLLRPIVGYLLDTGKRRVILIIGLVLMGLMPLGYLMVYTAVTSIMLVVVFRLFHGAALAFSNTSTATIATDIIPKTRFSEGMGMFGMATALATSVAPAVGEWLMGKGFAALFITAAIIMGVSLLLLAALNIPHTPASAEGFGLKRLVELSAVPASVVTLIFLLTYGALENYILKFAEDTADVTIPGGLYFTLMAIMLFLTRILLGKTADKKGEEIFVYSCNAAMMAALLMIGIIPGNVTFVLSALLSGYAFGGIEPALQSMAVGAAPPERRGSANSTFLCAYDIGIGIGGFSAGMLIEHIGYSHMFVIITAANIISAAVYIVFGRKHPSSMTYRIKTAAKA